MTSVGTSAVNFGSVDMLIQNLGPDDLYVGIYNGHNDGAQFPEDGNGIRLVNGESVSVNGSYGDVYCVSTGTSDVRSLPGGSGFFITLGTSTT